FGDGRGWPLPADGAVHSLVLAESVLNSTNAANLSYPGSWRASTRLNGSPGRADPLPVQGVVLNEITAHTDFLNEFDSNDWIELFNVSSAAIDLGDGWFLSDDPANLKKWQIPSGTILPPHAYVVFDEITGFHSQTGIGFGLSKDGEQVLLSHLPGTS